MLDKTELTILILGALAIAVAFMLGQGKGTSLAKCEQHYSTENCLNTLR